MKIKINTDKNPIFADLEVGDICMAKDNHLYIRIDSVYMNDTSSFNAICLNTGLRAWFDETSEVTPMPGTFTYDSSSS